MGIYGKNNLITSVIILMHQRVVVIINEQPLAGLYDSPHCAIVFTRKQADLFPCVIS
jgi:hypothetical protein